MGSWFETCALSQLPILDGDAVKVVFLKKRPEEYWDNTGRCNPLWEPVSLPLAGEYADYGRVNFHPTTPLDNSLFKQIKFVELDDPNPASWENLHAELRETLLGVSEYGGGVSVLGSCFVRADVFDAAAQLPTTGYFDITFEKAYAQVLKFAQDSEALRLEFAGKESDPKYYMSKWSMEENSWILGMYTHLGISARSFVSEHACSDYDLCRIANMVMISQKMSVLRKDWSPQAGTGSQEIGFDTHKLFALKIAEIAEQRRLENEY